MCQPISAGIVNSVTNICSLRSCPYFSAVFLLNKDSSYLLQFIPFDKADITKIYPETCLQLRLWPKWYLDKTLLAKMQLIWHSSHSDVQWKFPCFCVRHMCKMSRGLNHIRSWFRHIEPSRAMLNFWKAAFLAHRKNAVRSNHPCSLPTVLP